MVAVLLNVKLYYVWELYYRGEAEDEAIKLQRGQEGIKAGVWELLLKVKKAPQ